MPGQETSAKPVSAAEVTGTKYRLSYLKAVCETVLIDIRQTARARGQMTASEEMIYRQLTDALERIK